MLHDVLQAWLDPLHLPTVEQLTCATTGRLMRFLLQVYCPVDGNPVEAFHRMVFVFVSPRVRVRVRGALVGTALCFIVCCAALKAMTGHQPLCVSHGPLTHTSWHCWWLLDQLRVTQGHSGLLRVTQGHSGSAGR